MGIATCGVSLGAVSAFWQDNQEHKNKKRSMKSFLKMKGGRDGEESADQINPLQQVWASGQQSAGAGTGAASADNSISVDYRQSTATDGGSVVRRKSMRDIFQDISRSLHERPPERTFEEVRNDALKTFEEDVANLKWSVGRNLVVILFILLLGMGAMMEIEGWSSTDSFYWAVVSVMTVGYGELAPNTRAGKVFTIFYLIASCSWMAKALSDFVKYPLLQRVVKNEKKIIDQFSSDMHTKTLKLLFENEFYQLVPDLKRMPNEMSKCEFVLLLLLLMEKVEEKDIFLVAKIFENFDLHQRGYLTEEDMASKLAEARAAEQVKARAEIEDANARAEAKAAAAAAAEAAELDSGAGGFVSRIRYVSRRSASVVRVSLRAKFECMHTG